MAIINFTDLDFDQIKSSIKQYLRSSSDFVDFDFEGSNLSMIIDVLAYNTYINSYNANMITNEVFMDSATLRENVVSIARNLGYIPRSKTCAKAKINFSVNTSSYTTQPKTITLKAGLVCVSNLNNSKNYTFSIPDDITVPVINNLASFNDITVYEGSLLTTNYTVNTAQFYQKFILDNQNIDTSTIRVNVRSRETNDISEKYTQVSNIFNADPNSKIYLIQEIEDEKYELLFGDGIFGKSLTDLNYIEASYIVTNGSEANNISIFTFSGSLVDNNSNSITNGISLISTNSSSSGGKEIESVDSIKKYAPRRYSAQNRAVTASDFESIVPLIYQDAEAVSAFGGEELSPPKYGKVYITIKPKNGNYLSNTVKSNIIKDLKKYTVAGIIPEILDPKYLYIETSSAVYYNANQTSSADNLRTKISSAITSYANSADMQSFSGKFKYSKFQKIIDNVSDAITSNITVVRMRRDLKPTLNSFVSYELCFGNKFHVNMGDRFNIKSSGFTISGVSGKVYLSDIPNADGETGTMFLFKLTSPKTYDIVRNNIGTVNYKRGEILLNTLNITSTESTSSGENLIQVQAIPESNDVIGLQDLYLNYDQTSSSIDMVSDVIESGADISGSTYSFSSSFTNGSLTR